ncbi:MAG TPA: phosphatidate cytidylyltransferase [Nitriliruptorales bacterium]|nr:phosphatidate cytidylyltransferase [Nitriliruptorales bacterium]
MDGDATQRLPSDDDHPEPHGALSEPTRPVADDPGRGEDLTRPEGPDDRPRTRQGGGGSSPRGDQQRFTDRDLPVAVTAGVLLASLFLLTLLLHPAAFTALVVVLILLGVVETARVCRERDVRIATPVVVVAALVLLIGAYRVGHGGQAVGLVTLFVGAVVWELADPQRHDVFRTVAATVMLGLWVPFLGSYAVLLITWPADAWVAVLATVGVTVVADIGAYVVGTRFGSHQLAPSVSPGKTWEGVLGGVVVATGLAVATLPLLGSAHLFDVGRSVVFALVVTVAGVVGDLSESLLKRDLGVKDFGGIIPGHGGVLDRVDAILFALPTGYYTLSLLAR